MRADRLRLTDHVPVASAPPGSRPTATIPQHLLQKLGEMAADALTAELETFPKPGLVSPVDAGSHDDMDAHTFRRSIAALRPYFGLLAQAGADGADMTVLRRIGIVAEDAMLVATGGVNTHRGAIFALGLLCAAGGAAIRDDQHADRSLALSAARLCTIVSRRWGRAISRGPIPLASHGSIALRRFGAGGARAEAANGFPSALQVALPALRAGRRLAGAEEPARVHAFFALLAAMEDTNLLYRGGAAGLNAARAAARRFLASGGVGDRAWLAGAEAVHRLFVARRLSPGGSADLLAVAIFLDGIESGL